ncbi:hypothetical protein ANO11243_094410 [Dothideomycetidae sp. 11243]|nr:hypothetical protein ANO11243_094410 [fungal sp. No.11243]
MGDNVAVVGCKRPRLHIDKSHATWIHGRIPADSRGLTNRARAIRTVKTCTRDARHSTWKVDVLAIPRMRLRAKYTKAGANPALQPSKVHFRTLIIGIADHPTFTIHVPPAVSQINNQSLMLCRLYHADPHVEMFSRTSVILGVATNLALVVNATSVAVVNNVSSPAIQQGTGYGWANFYDDNACTVGRGIAVDMGNHGCLREYGRNSILINAGFNNNAGQSNLALIFTPGDQCNCQRECVEVNINNEQAYCWNLNGNVDATSFRFVLNGCPPNNC